MVKTCIKLMVLQHLSAFPVTLTYDLKKGDTALATYECNISYGFPSLRFITLNWLEKLLSASIMGPRLMIITLQRIFHSICFCGMP